MPDICKDCGRLYVNQTSLEDKRDAMLFRRLKVVVDESTWRELMVALQEKEIDKAIRLHRESG